MMTTPAPIGGSCSPKFERVAETFKAHLSDGNEIGAGVCVFLHGEKVVDLWGGWHDKGHQQLWKSDSIVCMQSTGKGVALMCILMLVDRGLLSLDQKVAHYWPEFAQAGKADISVRDVLSQGAGLPVLDAAPPGSAFERDVIVRAIEKQAPVWEPGSRHGYHIFTIGYFMDELTRRVAGIPIAEFHRRNIVEPLEADFFFGLRQEEEERCAYLHSEPASSLLAGLDPDSLLLRSTRPMPVGEGYNSPRFRRWGIPNAGHGNARGLATIFAAFLGDGMKPLVTPDLMREATREHWRGEDAVLGMPLRGALVLMLASEIAPMLGGLNCFGQPGAGGSLGCADPETGLAFAFCTNRAVPVGQETMMRALLSAAAQSV